MRAWLYLALALVCMPVAQADEIELDPATGFRMTGDWQLVRANCVPCHSSKLVTQQRGSAEQWLTMIRWMQKKQNLWQFDPDTEQIIGDDEANRLVNQPMRAPWRL